MVGEHDAGGGRELDADDVLARSGTAGWEKLELDASPRATGARPADPLSHLPALDDRAPVAPPASGPSAHEVAAVADFGAPPAGLFGTIPYALVVLTRLRALRRELHDLRRLEGTAARDLEEASIELGRALHAARSEPSLAPLAAQLAAAEDAGRVAGERTAEWQRARDAADAQRSSLTAKIGEAERAVAPHRDRETKLATQMDVRETDLRRAKARLSRVDIELRNLGGDGDSSRRAMLEAERQARAADVETAQSHVDELAPKLADARRELAVMLSALNDLVAQRRAVDAAEQRSERAHHSSAGDAERRYHAAVVELAREALARGLAEGVAPEAARAVTRMHGAHATRAREVKLYEAALRGYDVRAFQRGAALLGGAALIVVVALLFVILR